MTSSRRCREVFAARQDEGDYRCRTRPTCSTTARRSRQPLRFAVRGQKCLRGRCREVFAASRYNPISFPIPLLAVLVYRLVCQPVTLESWVRLPDAAHDFKSCARPAPGAEQAQTDCGQIRPHSFLRRAFGFVCSESVYELSVCPFCLCVYSSSEVPVPWSSHPRLCGFALPVFYRKPPSPLTNECCLYSREGVRAGVSAGEPRAVQSAGTMPWRCTLQHDQDMPTP